MNMYKRFFRRNYKMFIADFDGVDYGTMWAFSLVSSDKWYLGKFKYDKIIPAPNFYRLPWQVYRNGETLMEQLKNYLEGKLDQMTRPYPDFENIEKFKQLRDEGFTYRAIVAKLGKDLKTLVRWSKYDMTKIGQRYQILKTNNAPEKENSA